MDLFLTTTHPSPDTRKKHTQTHAWHVVKQKSLDRGRSRQEVTASHKPVIKKVPATACPLK